jgi:hypothetical protein
MNATLLASIAGGLLSLAFAYIPGVKTWFGNLAGTHKRLLMAALLLVGAGLSYALSCYWPVFAPEGVTCDEAGIVILVQSFIAALVTNQATYSLAVPTEEPKIFVPYPKDDESVIGGQVHG